MQLLACLLAVLCMKVFMTVANSFHSLSHR
jgi:hypothetical protein